MDLTAPVPSPRKRNKYSAYRGNTAVFKELTAKGRRLVDLMTRGLEVEHAAFPHLKTHAPLPLQDAAAVAGMRLKQAKFLTTQSVFQKAVADEVAAMLKVEQPRNLATLVGIRDDPLDHTAAAQTARLKATALLAGDMSGRSQNSVNVNVRNKIDNTVTPGYVLLLGPEPGEVEQPPIDVTPYSPPTPIAAQPEPPPQPATQPEPAPGIFAPTPRELSSLSSEELIRRANPGWYDK